MADKEVEQHFSMAFVKPTITLTNEEIQNSPAIKKIIISFINQCKTISPQKKEEIIQGLEKDKIDYNMIKFILSNLIIDENFDKALKQHIIDYFTDKTPESLFKARLENILQKQKEEYIRQMEIWDEEYRRQMKNWDNKYKELNAKLLFNYTDIKNKVESFLPTSSALGITEAFAKEMKQRQQTAQNHLYMVYSIIVFMIGIAYYVLFEMENQPILINFLHLLSLEAPLAFLVTLSAKKAHQNQRIYEEYAHKYTAAMTYIGLCKEVREHEEIYGKDAVKNLNEGFRHALFRNPSAAIDKKIEDIGTPFELVERLIQSVGQPAAEALIKSKSNQDA